MTDSQLDLLGLGDPWPAWTPTTAESRKRGEEYELFLALCPDAGSQADSMRANVELLQHMNSTSTSRMLKPKLLHITLIGLGKFTHEYRGGSMAAIEAACASVAGRAFKSSTIAS